MCTSLNSQKQKAALLIASGERLQNVAETVKVTPATISNWRKLPEFRAQVNSIQRELLKTSVSKLTCMSVSAMDRVEALIKSDNEKISLEACKLIMSANGLVGDTEGSLIRYSLWVDSE